MSDTHSVANSGYFPCLLWENIPEVNMALVSKMCHPSWDGPLPSSEPSTSDLPPLPALFPKQKPNHLIAQETGSENSMGCNSLTECHIINITPQSPFTNSTSSHPQTTLWSKQSRHNYSHFNSWGNWGSKRQVTYSRSQSLCEAEVGFQPTDSNT